MSRTEKTRKKLIDVAAKEFAERGFAKSSASRITREAGLTRGSLYYHFDTKEALFEAVYIEKISAIIADIRKLVEEAEAHTEKAHHLLRASMNCWLDHLSCQEYRQICLIEAKSVLGVERVQELDEVIVMEPLKRGFELLSEQGVIGPMPPEIFGAFITSIADRAGIMLSMEPMPNAKKDLREQLLDSIQLLVDALAHYPVEMKTRGSLHNESNIVTNHH